MSQTETAKAVAAEERTEETRSFVHGEGCQSAQYKPEREGPHRAGGVPGCEATVSDLCRREGIKPHSYYGWTKEFMEGGKERLTRDMVRDATQQEVQGLRRENVELKQLVAELSLEGYRLKKRLYRCPTTTPVPEGERRGEGRGPRQGNLVFHAEA